MNTIDEEFRDVIRRHAAIIKDLIIFNNIPQQDISRFLIHCNYKNLKAGDTLFKEGAQSLNLAILIEGETEILKGGKKIVSLASPALLGEIGLFTGMARNATVKARVNAVVLTLSQLALDSLFQKEPKLSYQIHKNIIQCLANKINEDNQKIVSLANDLAERETEFPGESPFVEKQASLKQIQKRPSLVSSMEVVDSATTRQQRKFLRTSIPDPSVCFVKAEGRQVYVKDISEGGIRLSLNHLPDALKSDLKEGASVSGTLCIKDARPMSFSGTVRIVFPNAVGVEFHKPTQGQEQAITDAIARLRRLAMVV